LSKNNLWREKTYVISPKELLNENERDVKINQISLENRVLTRKGH
jgi:hypothetical protein